ncbi:MULTISPECIES: Na-translocating system protein MpsC family protein [Bacillaceae]|uniref:DUF2294 domain-containing protein n=1 Tax=Evansella alkalicola TaxID=745819 RepID=A0ABS6JN40_9BACI|nr:MULTISPECIES: Na-translocating system protein MpsC family protein [Bacillaceae]MBU9719979.1 DUF2294 domain-containing protein [Bacillus alkalicola]
MIEEKEVKVQEVSTQVSSHISKQLKKHFGKGPEACHCTINKDLNVVLIQVRNFMTPAEEIMVKKDEMHLAASYRSLLIKSIFDSTKTELSRMTGFNFQDILHDWSYETNKGVLLILGNTDSTIFTHTQKNIPFSTNVLENTVAEMYSSFHKPPSNIETFLVHPKIYLVRSDEVMFPLENLLQEKGHEELLTEYYSGITDSVRDHKELIERAISSEIEDIFFARDERNGKSYLIIILKDL